jgi:hypothetical protein
LFGFWSRRSAAAGFALRWEPWACSSPAVRRFPWRRSLHSDAAEHSGGQKRKSPRSLTGSGASVTSRQPDSGMGGGGSPADLCVEYGERPKRCQRRIAARPQGRPVAWGAWRQAPNRSRPTATKGGGCPGGDLGYWEPLKRLPPRRQLAQARLRRRGGWGVGW